MIRAITALIICSHFFSLHVFSQSNLNNVNWEKLDKSHDILIQRWGPFSKKYAGISHVPEFKSGIRFDFSVMPGLYRYKPVIPNVLLHSDYYPWDVNSDLTRYTFRNELLWKDEVYTDVEYNVIDSSTVLIAIHCVNNTALPQNIDLNLMGYLDFPENYPNNKISARGNIIWKNAVDYKKLTFAEKSARDNLVYDGMLAGEARNSDYIDGRAIGPVFSKSKGNKLDYNINIDKHQSTGVVSVLYRMKENTQSTIAVSGLANQTVSLSGTGKFEQVSVPFSTSKSGSNTISFVSDGGADIEINGFAVIPAGEENQIQLVPNEKNIKPEMIQNLPQRNLILKYTDIAQYYGIAWDDANGRIREWKNDELDIYLRRHFNNHTYDVFNGNLKGDFSNVYIRPIELDAHDEQMVYAMVSTGTLEQVKRRMGELGEAKAIAERNKAKELSANSAVLPQGDKYEAGQKIMRATLMTNILYPIYTQDSYIRHFTPGKWYTSLYTWDSGFTALGLNEINQKISLENINAYTTALDNPNAFIQHGTPVPVQIYAFYDLWNKTQSKEMLRYLYPRLRKYYEFMAGRYGSSTTRTLKSNLLKTWDYFYNSGGWDDYPAQVTVHELKATKTVTPVINTATSIRLAKMLRLAAEALGEKKDFAKYDNDIKVFSEALQKYSWNDTAGYFSYVVHDQQGNPIGHFKHPASNTEHNMGLDGAHPLFSGICTPQQEKVLLDKIFSDKHMWTPTGICVVDQSAPYFKPVGYWNGSVWMPHQWFTWKAMLDLGRSDLAKKIADKALDIFKREIDASYSTFEYYSAKTGRGAGWHQFAGLTAPVINWFSAYYKPGTATTGFEIWIKKQSFANDNSSYKADFSFDKATTAHSRSMLVCLNPAYQYKVTFNGKEIKSESPYPGFVQINLPASNDDSSITISRLGK